MKRWLPWEPDQLTNVLSTVRLEFLAGELSKDVGGVNRYVE